MFMVEPMTTNGEHEIPKKYPSNTHTGRRSPAATKTRKEYSLPDRGQPSMGGRPAEEAGPLLTSRFLGVGGEGVLQTGAVEQRLGYQLAVVWIGQ